MTSGEYPLLTSADQSLNSYLKRSYTARYVEDLRQSLTLPEFAGWTEVNMLRFGGRMWWVLDSRTSSDTAKAIRFEVSCCGPSSLIHKGDSIKGIWSRLPSNECPYMQRQAVSSDMIVSRSVELPNLGLGPNDEKIYWVEVTATVKLSDSAAVDSQDTITRYGFFSGYHFEGYSTGVVYKDDILSAFATIERIINEPESFGFQANTIIDISISERCPWQYTKAIYTYSDQSFPKMVLKGGAPQVIAANAGAMYRLDRSFILNNNVQRLESVVQLTISDLERASGSVSLRAADGSNIAIIPPALGTTIPITVQCVSDYGAIYTRVKINNTYYKIPEGHLPWVGSTWENYKAYSLAFDRQAMEQSIDYANQRAMLGIAEAGANAVANIAMGAIGGNPLSIATGAVSGAVSFGISTWANLEGQRITESESRATQALSERRVKAQAGTPYNTGYGMIYCDTAYLMGLQVQIDMPGGLTSDIDTSYTEQFGYPAENVRTYTIRKGFIQGRLLDDSLTRGRLFDSANSDLQRGIRFVEV